MAVPAASLSFPFRFARQEESLLLFFCLLVEQKLRCVLRALRESGKRKKAVSGRGKELISCFSLFLSKRRLKSGASLSLHSFFFLLVEGPESLRLPPPFSPLASLFCSAHALYFSGCSYWRPLPRGRRSREAEGKREITKEAKQKGKRGTHFFLVGQTLDAISRWDAVFFLAPFFLAALPPLPRQPPRGRLCPSGRPARAVRRRRRRSVRERGRRRERRCQRSRTSSKPETLFFSFFFLAPAPLCLRARQGLRRGPWRA